MPPFLRGVCETFPAKGNSQVREDWRPKPADRIVRHPRESEMGPVQVTVTPRRAPARTNTSPLIIMCTFAGLIAAGTLLLLLPFMHHGQGFTPFMDALFTATSAATVTGLLVQDTATYWTRTGQVVIVALMFVGGLGFMTAATFMLVLFRQRMSISQRVLARDSLGLTQLGGLVRLTAKIVVFAMAVQIAGFVALFIRFSFLFSPAEAVWQAVFHSVSGFNNAGFVALPDTLSLTGYSTDKWLISTIGSLILIGSLSYWVLEDVFRTRRIRLWSLNTKLVLATTVALLAIGMGVFFASEYHSTSTLQAESVGDKAFLSTFQSVSRTAGFDVVNFASTKQHTDFLYTGLMFIGGASTSVAGGIKVNTFAVILVAIISGVRGQPNATAFGRVIPQAQVQRAMTIGAVAIGFVFIIASSLTFLESQLLQPGMFSFIDLLFESFSAFGTVGFSTGVTPQLSDAGQALIAASMFIGRIGPLTIALAMLARGTREMFRYAEERVTIG